MAVAGADIGTECVKAIVADGGGRILGRATVPTRGYFQDCFQEALTVAAAEAQLKPSDLERVCATGFGASCAGVASRAVTETLCHARGAFHQQARAMTLVDIGGRDPKVIHVDASGTVVSSKSVRKCAVGIGTFLMFTSRHLDVHPTRLMDLAATAAAPAKVGSYCSVFAEVEVIELLRSGATAGEIALGAMYSVADRILEMDRLAPPLVITGGVCEYFPGVVKALAERSGLPVEVAPEPIMAGALGAALFALDGDPGPEPRGALP
ncbi:MAG TPA: acyl-CoA dehydratase activase [Anaeromyxobacteraceae bacterium]|nr:acyl-CoA dehydratase activase [Anaeromyxobacteraceae bacterium]